MTTFQPSPAFRMANRMVAPLIRLGIPIGVKRAPMALLTVKGRKSGRLHTTPIALAIHEDGWLLIAVYGISDWSRNLEAAGSATVTMRGRTTEVSARRLGPEEAAPVLRDSIAKAPTMIRRMTDPYFKARGDSPLRDWALESVAHPVFVLESVPR